eukprot:1662007-Prorocentrum_lima.AAC.1
MPNKQNNPDQPVPTHYMVSICIFSHRHKHHWAMGQLLNFGAPKRSNHSFGKEWSSSSSTELRYTTAKTSKTRMVLNQLDLAPLRPWDSGSSTSSIELRYTIRKQSRNENTTKCTIARYMDVKHDFSQTFSHKIQRYARTQQLRKAQG